MEPIFLAVFFLCLGLGLGYAFANRKREPAEAQFEFTPRVLKISNENVVVLTVPGALSAETAERLKKHWERLAPETRCIVLGDGISVNCILDPSKT